MHRTLGLRALFVASTLAVWSSASLAISTTIVISEFRTRGPNGVTDELVEIYNLSASTVDIGGWRLRSSSNTGVTLTTRATVPASTMLPPGCHYLFTSSSYNGATPGNQTLASGIADNGGVTITLPDGTPVDQVGMCGTDGCYHEGITLAPLSGTADQSYERKPGGVFGSGQDTDDNAADFSLISPSHPENSNSSCVAVVSVQPTDPPVLPRIPGFTRLIVPNPFRDVARFAIWVPVPQPVDLSVFDLVGRRIATLHRGMSEAGEHLFEWDGVREGGDLAPSGLYLVRFRSGAVLQTRRVMLVR